MTVSRGSVWLANRLTPVGFLNDSLAGLGNGTHRSGGNCMLQHRGEPAQIAHDRERYRALCSEQIRQSARSNACRSERGCADLGGWVEAVWRDYGQMISSDSVALPSSVVQLCALCQPPFASAGIHTPISLPISMPRHGSPSDPEHRFRLPRARDLRRSRPTSTGQFRCRRPPRREGPGTR